MADYSKACDKCSGKMRLLFNLFHCDTCEENIKKTKDAKAKAERRQCHKCSSFEIEPFALNGGSDAFHCLGCGAVLV